MPLEGKETVDAQAAPALWVGLAARGSQEALAARRTAFINRAHNKVRAEHAARLESLRQAERYVMQAITRTAHRQFQCSDGAGARQNG